MTVVTIREATTRLSRLLRQAISGEEIAIAKAGVLVARWLPLASNEPRRRGLASGRATEAFFEPLPPDELAGWQQEAGLGPELKMRANPAGRLGSER